MDWKKKLIRQFNRKGKGWSAGATCDPAEPNIFYECGGKGTSIAKRNSMTGETIAIIPTDIPTSIHDISIDPFSRTIWASLGGGLMEYHQLSMDTFKTIKKIKRPNNSFGIFCDREENGIAWIADQERYRILKISLSYGNELWHKKIFNEQGVPIKPRGIAKVKDGFWISEAREPGDGGILYKFDLDGNFVDKTILPYSKYSHDLGGLSVIGDSELLAMGGKGLPIYIINISNDNAEVIPDEPTDDEQFPTNPEEENEDVSDKEDIEESLNFIIKIIKAFFGLFKKGE